MGKLHQFHTTLACSFGTLVTGVLYVWPSYTLGLYTAQNNTLLSAPMTEIEGSLLGSLPSLGAMFGTITTGWVINTFGRHKGGMILTLPFVASWLMIDLTSSSIVILTARFLGGTAAGGFLVYAPIFVSEVADESIRGTLASFPMMMYCMGVLVSYLLGWFLTYRYIIWANLICSLATMALIMTVTESPVYLMRQKREEEARMSIAHYRGESPTSKVVLEEFSRLKQQLIPAVELFSINTDDNSKAEEAEKEKLTNGEEAPVETKNMPSYKLLFSSPSLRRALTVTCLTLSLQVWMGMVPVQVYAKAIFTQAAPNLSSHFCSVMFALILLCGSLVSAVFSDRFGRRLLLLMSSVSVALCLASMGMLLQTSIAPPWVTAIIILMYCFFFMLGSGSVPYVLLAEVFVPEVQSFASMLLMEWIWLLNFVIVAIFPFMIKYFGVHGTFYAFAVFAICDTLVTIFMVPETKGLSSEQIQEAFLGRKRR